MTSLKKCLLASLALLCLPWAVHAHGGGWSVGIRFGVPVYYRPYYDGYYYYRPYPVYVQPAPVVLQPAPVVLQSSPAPEQINPSPTLLPAPTTVPAVVAQPRQDQVDPYLRQLSSADENARAG